MTNADFLSWLKSASAIRTVLMEVQVQVGGVETTRFLSNRGYVTGPNDSPSNTVYSPAISGGVSFTEALSLEGAASLSYGDIELSNPTGDRDSWFDDIWSNRPVQIYIGDATWNRSDFFKVFDGIVVAMSARERNKFNLKLSDKLQKINTPISDVRLGGTSSAKDTLIPLCFGECHNVTPRVVDSANLVYQVHTGPIERIIEVRDNGVPVQFTPDVANGKFSLDQNPAGTITCSVQGDKPNGVYTNNIANIIKRIVKDFGDATLRLTDADLDLANLTAFGAANTQPVGIYLTDKTNVLEVVNNLATSVGARVAMSRLGLLRLVKLDLSSLTAGTTVTQAMMANKSIAVSQLPDVVAAVQMGYCKNWTVQSSLTTGLPAEHIALYAQEWLTSTVVDNTVADLYRIHTEPTMIESYLLVEADAIAEATRRLNMFKVQRKAVKYQGFSDLMLEKLGDGQTVQNERFGLSAGKTGQIISLATDWLKCSVTVEVLI